MVSPRNLDAGTIEMKYRTVFDAEQHAADLPTSIPLDGAAETIKGLVEKVRANGVPVEYLLFPDEGHGFRRRENRIRASEAWLAFAQKYLRPDADRDQ